MHFEFTAEVWYWRGPAPFYFVSLPADACDAVRDLAGEVSYGWGMIPVRARIGDTSWETSLWPKDGSYALPLKVAVRRAERVDEGEQVHVDLAVEVRGGRWVTEVT